MRGTGLSKAATRLILWRHGLTDFNAENRFQGQLNVPLNETGVAQAKAAARVLSLAEPQVIYSSPLKRALTTANEIAELTGLKVHIDKRLEEINVGSWAGRTLAELAAENPEQFSALGRDEDFRRSPQGETATETGCRVAEALEEIAHSHAGRTVLVASHGLAIRMGVAELLGMNYSQAVKLAIMNNCAWSIVEHRDQTWRLMRWNVTAA